MKLTMRFARLSMAVMMASLVALLTTSQLASPVSAMGVVAFDYGTEWIKVSLVKPGLPFDVVLDRDSKRKIQSAVAFKKWGNDEEILFGTNAYNHATREPKQSFYALKMLLGRSLSQDDEPYVKLYQDIFGSDVVSSDRGTCSLKRPYEYDPKLSSLPVLSVEELVAMQLEYAKKLAEETASERVNPSFPTGFNVGAFGGLDAVVTVPAFFTAQERQSIVDAAALAGFRPRLVSDGAAAAVNYAQTRTFPQPETHLFFDAGSGSIRATVVEFSTKPIVIDSILSVGKAQKEATIVDVKGVGWQRDVAGLALDLLLREMLVIQFDASHGSSLPGGSIRSNHRAMARLLKEANRIKHILSANDVASSAIESLVDDIDFKTSIQRHDFENAAVAAGMVPKFTSPISQALDNAGLSLHQIKSIVLVGGSTRVPLVLNALKQAGIPDDKLAQNVNADEAAVMGAAFYGASFNPQFRMKEIRAYDLIPYAVNLKDADGKVETLFPAQSYQIESVLRQYPNAKNDFVFELEYDASAGKRLQNDDRSIAMVEISGIDESLREIKASQQLDNVDTHVNLTVVSRPLGVYSVENAVLVIKPKPGGISGALKSFFGMVNPAKKANSTANDKAANTTAANADDQNAEMDDETKVEGAEAEAEAEEPLAQVPAKDKLVKLHARTIPQNDKVRPMSGEELKKSKDKLWIMGQAAVRKAQREEARNTMESYLYRVRDLVDDETYKQVSKPQECNAIAAKVDELSAWLSDQGETADTSTLKLNRAALEALVKPLETRIEQSRLRDVAFELFQTSLDEATAFVAEARANLTAAMAANESSKYSVTELDSLESTLQKDNAWFEKGKAEQSRKSASDDPVLLSSDLDHRRKKVQDTVAKLKKRRIAKTRPQKKKTDGKSKPQEDKSDSPHQDKKENGHKEQAKNDGTPRHEEL